MIRFLFKGLMRDRSRSLFPVLTVTIGVFITVLGHSWFIGAMGGMLGTSANFETGYVKIMSRAYAKLSQEMPNELALVGVDSLLAQLRKSYPDWQFTPRIRFGGLIDIPDANGETRLQGPAMGLGVDLLGGKSGELKRLNIAESIVRGRLPQAPDEILIADKLAQKLDVQPGEVATLISSTMYGNMAISNFRIAGTVNFGIQIMDKGAIIADLKGVQQALDMDDAAGEIVGYKPDMLYQDDIAHNLVREFNQRFAFAADDYAPTMITLADQGGLDYILKISDSMGFILVTVFIFVMSLVLWNSGLMGSLRRYGEIGIRLAIGEAHGHIYRSLLAESMIIGLMGSLSGTIIGLALAFWIQVHGIDIGSMMQGSSIMMDNVLRTHITPATYYIGFIPGVVATFIGTAFAGVGIYRRQTASLFKELEV